MSTRDRARVGAVIPARMGSSRFPGKPLTPILGLPMIEHVYRRTALCALVDDVFVATCDRAIAEAVEAFGGRVLMTSASHERASDRVAEAAASMDHDIVVMVQGDEPAVLPGMVEEAVDAMLRDEEIGCVNLAAPFASLAELEDPNAIKVVTDRAGRAIFFTRRPVPTLGDGGLEGAPVVRQVCVIPFRRDALLRFASLEPTPLEKAESVDMLRFLEHGVPVHMVPTRSGTHPVDVPADVPIVEALLRRDGVTLEYMEAADVGRSA